MKSNEILQPEEIIEVLEKSREPKRDPSEILIWAGLGLILVLLYAVLLTTHWFS